MTEEDKKERLLKRLKDIEDKSEKQLKAIKDKNQNKNKVTDFVKELLCLEEKELIEEIRIIQKDVDYRKLKITDGNKNTNDFSDYKRFRELLKNIYYRNMSINKAEQRQGEFETVLGVLSE